MVNNLVRLIEGDYAYVDSDILRVFDTAWEYGVDVKILLETGHLDDEQKQKAIEIAISAGVAHLEYQWELIKQGATRVAVCDNIVEQLQPIGLFGALVVSHDGR